MLPSPDVRASELKELPSKIYNLFAPEEERLFWYKFDFDVCFHRSIKLGTLIFWDTLLLEAIRAIPDLKIGGLPLECPLAIKKAIALKRIPKNYAKEKHREHMEELAKKARQTEAKPEPEPFPPSSPQLLLGCYSPSAKLARRQRLRALINKHPIPTN